jgi:hypothetical protein
MEQYKIPVTRNNRKYQLQGPIQNTSYREQYKQTSYKEQYKHINYRKQYKNTSYREQCKIPVTGNNTKC